MRLRRLRIERDAPKGGKPGIIEVIANDMTRSAVEIAALYKARWAIELLFRWHKQHLKIRKFLGENENAIRIQLIAAMIAFVLLRIAAKLHAVTLPALRYAELAGRWIFDRRPLDQIDKPPPKYTPIRRRKSPNQMELSHAWSPSQPARLAKAWPRAEPGHRERSEEILEVDGRPLYRSSLCLPHDEAELARITRCLCISKLRATASTQDA